MAQINFLETPPVFVEKKISKKHMPVMHYHGSYEIFYIIKGEREYFIEDEFFKLKTGDLVIIPKGLLHRTTGKEATRFLINFSEEYLKRYFTEKMLNSLSLTSPFVFRPREGDREYLNSLFNGIYAEYLRMQREDNALTDAKISGYLYQILFTVSYLSNDYVGDDDSLRNVSSIVKYINENYAEINGISEISEKFFISKYHLCRMFGEKLGVSLITYLNNIKVQRAKELIREGAIGITEVALSVGFNSSSYFCKVFKAETGLSPTEYRKQNGI